MSQTLGPTLRFETPDFIMRSLVLGDESETWGAWFADPRIAAMLNAEPRARTLDQLRDYINLHDRKDRHVFGIFTKGDNRLIGIRTADIDRRRRAFSVHMLVGSDADWGGGSMDQTTEVLNNWTYETCDLLWSEASVLARNKKMVRYLVGLGWSVAGGGMVPSALDGKLIETVALRRHRDIWRKDPRSSFVTGIPAPTGLESAATD